MSELNRGSFEAFLANEEKRKKQLEAEIEIVSQILEENIQQAVAAFEEENQELIPQAQEKLTSVIKPWWYDFESSGVYQQVLDYLNEEGTFNEVGPVAHLAGPIVYPVLRVPTTPAERNQHARSIMMHQKGNADKAKSAASGAFADPDNSQNLWVAHFYLAGNHQQRHAPGFGISRWPTHGSGFAYALEARRNDIPLHRGAADQLLTKVHPQVLIGFADQIESGQVYANLEESLREKEVKIITSEEHARSQEELIAEYWEKKQGRG